MVNCAGDGVTIRVGANVADLWIKVREFAVHLEVNGCHFERVPGHGECRRVLCPEVSRYEDEREQQKWGGND